MAIPKPIWGRKCVRDFGTDATSAKEWLETGKWIGFSPDTTGRHVKRAYWFGKTYNDQTAYQMAWRTLIKA